MAGVGHRAAEAPALPPLQDPGNWLDLDAVPKAGASFESKKKLQNLLSRKSPSPSRGPATDDDALSVSLRRHALRAFLEETCGTVANAFDIMAGLALKASMGGSGTCDDRLHFTFHEEDFHLSLTHLGYGLGAKEPWWSALFAATDVDEDGVVSLQDMYDALVLALPNDKEAPQVFFTEPHQKNTWLRERSEPSALQRLSSPQREKDDKPELALERALSQFIMEEYPEELLETAEAVPPQEEPSAPTAPPTPARFPPATVAPPVAAAEPPGKLTLQLAPERRMTDSESWEQLWEQLRLRGWTIVLGPRGDRYWLPPGVKREWPWQNRKDYFDSKKQVPSLLNARGKCAISWIDSIVIYVSLKHRWKIPHLPSGKLT
ncbi:unnamed protein product [Cladocopium goreaui]|uniref:Dipeptidyl peptidase 1 n=1 Tax=Cladocopium goreaui TaxID=2562237 RepID=A0A9P1C6E9_9DINO|nr:unnamed protein product [Cladocopium goreaui]